MALSRPEEEDERDGFDDKEWEEKKEMYLDPDDMDVSEM